MGSIAKWRQQRNQWVFKIKCIYICIYKDKEHSSGKSINTDLEEKMSLWKENREYGVKINGKLDNESKLE